MRPSRLSPRTNKQAGFWSFLSLLLWGLIGLLAVLVWMSYNK